MRPDSATDFLIEDVILEPAQGFEPPTSDYKSFQASATD
jgi:hypothetical protein